ncbi:beta-ketoacyl synthase [Odoribacter sp. OttesenSCG-928-L07]|nr:beta-ketoacyl synthase [Odoribacter sp. OttesenSCG-928-L07]MDL2238909.1 beta-ketoacyl synthase [Bacteroidales bacterium OttesenSCG-928-L14]
MKVNKIIAHNIISSLGITTEENYNNVISGNSGVKKYEKNIWSIPEPIAVANVDKIRIYNEFINKVGINPNDYTLLETIGILSSFQAVNQTEVDLKSERTIFIFSSTKGNIELLELDNSTQNEKLFLWNTASLISNFYSNPNKPIVISNACISGSSAMIVADKLLNAGIYDTAIIIGFDVLSKFAISGFQSFQALSPERCKPFDINRIGLNLGEAAATIVMQSSKDEHKSGDIIFHSGSITNDANHISGPSRTAEGLYKAIEKTIIASTNSDIDFQIDFICTHGTSTPYNDDMEALAITRNNLENIPAFSLKGYFGHTLGAAGILENIISIELLKNNMIIKSLGYEICGVKNPINISTTTHNNTNKSFLKTISGFGGCNAATIITKI